MAHYATHHLAKERPDRFIPICGTNDLPITQSLVFADEVIAKQVIGIGNLAKSFCVTDVHISSLIMRRGRRLNQRIQNINSILQAECIRQGFIFINNFEINSFQHLDEGGFHLNDFGTAILKMNILKCFTSFNPFLTILFIFMTRLIDGLMPAGETSRACVVPLCCLLYTSPSPRDRSLSRMPSSA